MKDIQHPSLSATASSYKTALVPLSITETTTFAMMVEKRATRDRDWEDVRALLQWKLRTRQFLLPLLDSNIAQASNPISMHLTSIRRIIRTYPTDAQDLARQLDQRLPGSALLDESRLSEQEWIRLSDDLLR